MVSKVNHHLKSGWLYFKGNGNLMNKKKQLNRREFLLFTAGVGAAAACGSMLTGCDDFCEPQAILPGYKPRVSSAWIPKGQPVDNYSGFKSSFNTMVETATDFSWLSPGNSVFLKLSLNSPYPFPATTDPWSLRCMIELLQEKGADEIIVGDQSGVGHVYHTETEQRGRSRDCCQQAGLLKVMTDLNVTPCFFEEKGYDAYREMWPAGSHHWDVPIRVTTLVDEVDHLIHMPRVANHIMANQTFGLKISIGYLRDDSRLSFHGRPFLMNELYEEINHIPAIESKLRLIVSSGRIVMTTNGPDSGQTSEPAHGLIFASEDLLANDLLASAWLEANRQENQPGDIYCHPAIKNFMTHKGGLPETLIWHQTNQNPDTSIPNYMRALLKI